MKRMLISLFLLMATAAQAEVNCANENILVSESTPSAEFGDNGDGTVTHTRTGLIWMRCALGMSWDGSTCIGTALTYNWYGALQVTQDVNSGVSNADGDGAIGFASQTDWRLPNIRELESIVEERCWAPSINAAIFPNTPFNPLQTGWWSSSPRIDFYQTAWLVGFSDGYVGTYDKGSGFEYVRLVRTGQ